MSKDNYKEDNYELIIKDGVLVRVIGRATEVIIPPEVTAIADYAFTYVSTLKCVTIGENVKTIGNDAFQNLYNLTYVDLENVETIEDCAFENCINLAEIGWSKRLKHIGKAAFKRCKVLSNVDLYEGLERIDVEAFACDGAIRSVVLPRSLKYLGNRAFFTCQSLSTVEINAMLDMTGESTFKDCGALEQVKFNNGIRIINNTCFANCKRLRSVNLDKCIAIEDQAFMNCFSLDVTLPNTLRYLGVKTFHGDRSIQKLNIPDALSSISRSAFESCSGITKVTGGKNLLKIEENAFNGCSSIESFPFNDDIVAIEGYAFNLCSHLDLTQLPKSLVTLGAHSFSRTKIQSLIIDIPNVSECAFSNCFHLSKVIFGKNVKKVGPKAFDGCSHLRRTTYLGTLAEWCEISFMSGANPLRYSTVFNTLDVADLKDLTIPPEIKNVGSYTFEGFAPLNSIVIDHPLSIEDGAFVDCSNVKIITIHKDAVFKPTSFINCTEFPELFYYPRENLANSIFYYYVKDELNDKLKYCIKYLERKAKGIVIEHPLTKLNIENMETTIFKNSLHLIKLMVVNNNSIAFEYFFKTHPSFKMPQSEWDKLIKYKSIAPDFKALILRIKHNLDSLETHEPDVSTDTNTPSDSTKDSYELYRLQKGYIIEKHLKHERYVTIPDQIDNIPVIAIAENAFSGDADLEYVAIGKYVSLIGRSAFWDCPNLCSVDFNNLVDYEIQDMAFLGCTAIKKVKLGANLKIIGVDIFPISVIIAAPADSEALKYAEYNFYQTEIV